MINEPDKTLTPHPVAVPDAWYDTCASYQTYESPYPPQAG